MDAEQAKALRAAFPASVIGKLPKAGVTLSYVGHAAVTDRLLTVDPAWSWEPLALDADGLPAMDKAGNLWIRLTVCGVTRLGVGDGKSQKERIGDALRNAAMRFGVALDLWTKDELESEVTEAPRPAAESAPPQPEPRDWPDAAVPADKPLTDTTRKQLFALMGERGVTDADAQRAAMGTVLGRVVESRSSITEAEALRLIASLRGRA